MAAGTPLIKGEWLWTTRAGAEIDLIEELALAGVAARPVGGALVAAGRCPTSYEPAFARQGLPVSATCPADTESVYRSLLPHLTGLLALHVWVGDSDEGNALSTQAAKLAQELRERIDSAHPGMLLADGPAAKEAGGRLLQVCLLSAEQAAVGALRAVDAHSLAPGGRLRTHVDRAAPSRSAMKLAEALSWLGRGSEPEDVCVDLGASPGGWTYVISQRHAHVVAVDPGRLAPNLRDRKGIEHLRMDAFRFEPELPADWLFCDMAWRPLEVAALLAKWGRKHWARFLLANIKLPMRRRADMLRRVKEILATGGWTAVRVRQLYHDRDEVTVSAWRGFGVDARAPRQAKASTAPVGTTRAGTARVGTAKAGTANAGTAKARTAQVRTAKAGTAKARTNEGKRGGAAKGAGLRPKRGPGRGAVKSRKG